MSIVANVNRASPSQAIKEPITVGSGIYSQDDDPVMREMHSINASHDLGNSRISLGNEHA